MNYCFGDGEGEIVTESVKKRIFGKLFLPDRNFVICEHNFKVLLLSSKTKHTEEKETKTKQLP